MKNVILFIISLLFSLNIVAQTSKEQEIYTQAVENLNKGNFKKADFLFSQYIIEYDIVDISAYYNLAVARFKLGDTCSFCNNIWKASVLGDIDAFALYNQYCLLYKEKLKKYYKENDSFYVFMTHNNLKYNNLLEYAIIKSEVGDKYSLCKTLEDEKNFPKDVLIKNTPLMLEELRKIICWIDNEILLDSLENGNIVYNAISTNIATNKRKYTYYEKEKDSLDNIKEYLFDTIDISKGYIMKVLEKEINQDTSALVLYIDTTETKSKDTSKYEIKIIKNEKSSVLTFVEIMPEYDGGEDKLYEFLGNNLKFPKDAIKNKITGTVIVNFIIEKDGSVSNVRILRDIGGGCGEEAARVVRAMPKWIPGKQSGKPVRVFFNLPIKFTM